MVDVEDNCDALLVLRVADVVQLGDGEEGVGEVDVVQVEVLEDPPDQPSTVRLCGCIRKLGNLVSSYLRIFVSLLQCPIILVSPRLPPLHHRNFVTWYLRLF